MTKQMREKRGYWFEVTVSYLKQMEDGTDKKANEIYTTDAVSFGEAENRTLKELKNFVRGGVEIKNINPAPYKEVFFSDDEKDDKWYKAKLSFITLDEETGQEKRSNVTYLVQAENLESALSNMESVMDKGKNEYTMANIAETKVMEVYEH
jgi:hypothetical protein